MKTKFFLILTIFMVAVVTTSCKKATFLKADKESINIPRLGSTEMITLSSDVEGFKVESAPEWAETSIEGNSLTVTVPENDANSMRKSTIIVTVRGLKLEIPIIQNYIATYLRVVPASANFNKNGGEQTLKVETDGDVIIDTPSDIETTYENGSLKITVPANSGSKRNETITLTADNLTTTVAVKIEGSICQRCHGTGKITCPDCHGIGYIDGPAVGGVCQRCGGIPDPDALGTGDNGSGKITCPDCHGVGH